MVARLFFALALLFTILSIHKCKPVDLGPVDQTGPSIDSTPTASIDTTKFTCSGKTTCSQMTSCPEARYYLKNCPFQNIDGDGDGIPCEDQWCGH
jgi:hypothetical protein